MGRNTCPAGDCAFCFWGKGARLIHRVFPGVHAGQPSRHYCRPVVAHEPADYLSYNFRPLYRFKIDGLPVIAPMIGIRDFSTAEGSDIPTPVEFFVEPPFSIVVTVLAVVRLIECEYYQDTGPTMRQTTLDTWKIAMYQPVVDGVELVVAPISFGYVENNQRD